MYQQNTNFQQTNAPANFCMFCGAKLTPGAQFCSSCGKAQTQPANTPPVATPPPTYNQPNYQQAPNFNAQNQTQMPPVSGAVSRKEFINKYAQPAHKKSIISTAILCYFCASVTFVVSCLFNPLGVIEALLLLGLALGMHIAKSRVCAFAILILSIIEVVLSLTVGSFPFWWLIAGVSAVTTFIKIEKEYKQFLSNLNRF